MLWGSMVWYCLGMFECLLEKDLKSGYPTCWMMDQWMNAIGCHIFVPDICGRYLWLKLFNQGRVELKTCENLKKTWLEDCPFYRIKSIYIYILMAWVRGWDIVEVS